MADEKLKPKCTCTRTKQFLQVFRLTKEGATPIKWHIVITVTLALFGNAFILTFPFAFLPYMVLHFGFVEEDKGYYVGIIASSYFFGRIVGSFFWGWLSDKKGRRPVMLINIALNALLCPAFGFSINIWLACLFRFLIGTMTGVLTCTKTVLYEVSDNTNQAFAMSCIGISWGLGIILGPAVGGFLAAPAEKYPSVFPEEGFFAQFPFLLPCLVASFLNVLGFLLVFIKLPETLHQKKEKTEKDLTLLEAQPTDDADLTRISTEMLKGEQRNAMQSLDNIAMLFAAQDIEDTSLYRMKSEAYMHFVSHQNLRGAKTHTNSSHDNIAVDKADRNLGPQKRKLSLSAPDLVLRSRLHQLYEKSPPKEADGLLLKDKHDADVKVDVVDDGSHQQRNCLSRMWRTTKRSMLGRLLRSSDVRITLLAYSLFSFCVIGYEEVLGVWASTEVRLDGLGFTTNQLGMLALMASIPILVLQLFIFSKLEARFGIKRLIFGCSFVLCILAMLLPILHLVYDRQALLWTCLFFVLAPIRICVMCVFTGLGIFLNNSVSPAMAGSVNGLGLTVSATARTVAPLIGGSVFAWSITSDLQYPFDVNCVFVLFGICYGVTNIIILFSPERLNLQCKRHQVIDQTKSGASDKEEKGACGDAGSDNEPGDENKQTRAASAEENANEKGAEWYLKEGQTVAIVERNVPGDGGKEKSTAL